MATSRIGPIGHSRDPGDVPATPFDDLEPTLTSDSWGELAYRVRRWASSTTYVNAIVAASEVLVPVNMTDEGALQGAAGVRSIVAQLALRSDVRVRALVRQMVDRRRIVYQQMNEALPDLGLPIARTEIPLTAAFQNAAAERLPLLQWQANAAGAEAYRDLAAELLEPSAVALA